MEEKKKIPLIETDQTNPLPGAAKIYPVIHIGVKYVEKAERVAVLLTAKEQHSFTPQQAVRLLIDNALIDLTL